MYVCKPLKLYLRVFLSGRTVAMVTYCRNFFSQKAVQEFFLEIIRCRIFFHSNKQWDSPNCKTTEILSQRLNVLLNLVKKAKAPADAILIRVSMDVTNLYTNIPKRRGKSKQNAENMKQSTLTMPYYGGL